jgi:hypothetical protein
MATWPGTPGGASSPHWGPNIRLYVWVALTAGWPFTLGPHPNDRLDSGNVLSRATNPVPPGAATRGTSTGKRLWHDVTCDVVDLNVRLGATENDGVLARAEAATATIVLRDPDRVYDPLNPASPWTYQGQSRLVPGVPVVVFVEVLDAGGAIHQITRFTGTADSWLEPWTPHPAERRCRLVASDAVKDLVALDRGEQPAVGAGDTVDQRIARICTYYGWPGARVLDASTVTLQATTLAQSAWELIGRATDDEIGYTYLDATGTLRFYNRARWLTSPPPVIAVGCTPTPITPAPHDIVVAAEAGPLDLKIRNAVYAARVGGTQQVARVQASIDRYGGIERSYKRTDLGVTDDPQAAAWANYVVGLQAWPVTQLHTATLVPALDPASWLEVLSVKYMTDRARVLWTPPDDPTVTYDTTARVLGVEDRVTYQRWELTWQLTQAQILNRTWHLGPHRFDRLDDGNVLALTHT